MNARLLPLLVLTGWVGAALLLSCSRLVRRPSLTNRLRSYQPLVSGTSSRPVPAGSSGSEARATWRRLLSPPTLGPQAARSADRLAILLGSSTQLEQRLARAGLPVDPLGFRSRQALSTAAAALCTGAVAGTLGLPALAALGVVVATATAAFLFHEQRLLDAMARRDAQFRLELPIVAEQLGMLLGAGWSLGSAMNRLAARGQGVVAEQLGVVCGRIRHGLAESEALTEWSASTDLVALGRLVDVLSMDRHTSDVGRLIAEEARAMRRDAHRQLLEQIERRSQAVWVPVTLAALVPGLLFLAVPFVDALRLFSAG